MHPAELPDPDAGESTLEHVRFRYEPDRPLIEDFSLDVSPGQTVAIVGPTGAGKTTLVNLLMRFYEIDAGRITLDGVDAHALTRDDVRALFGMVLQDTWLFTGTIRDNIAYGSEGATDEEILAAAEAAYVDHFVRTLPEGYDTVIDEDASNISPARSSSSRSPGPSSPTRPILILDEATSSSTPVPRCSSSRRWPAPGADGRASSSPTASRRSATPTLSWSWRPGSIVEQGTHAELIARKGAYANLYESQFTEAFVEAV